MAGPVVRHLGVDLGHPDHIYAFGAQMLRHLRKNAIALPALRGRHVAKCRLIHAQTFAATAIELIAAGLQNTIGRK
jgi:hypothetical protein